MNVIMLNIPPRNYNPNPIGYSLGIKQKHRSFFCYIFQATEKKSINYYSRVITDLKFEYKYN